MRKVLAIVLTVLMLAVSVSAQINYVEDNARLLTSAETQTLEENFAQYHNEYGFTVALVTVSSLDGQSAAEYASNYYLYTSGIAAEVITDEMIAKLDTQMKADLESGKYYDACKTLVKKCTNPVCERINADALADKTLQREHRVFVFLGLGGGLLIGIAVVLFLSMRFKKPSKKK